MSIKGQSLKMSLLASAMANKDFTRPSSVKGAWLAALPMDAQKEVLELVDDIIGGKLAWSIEGTRRFVLQELKGRGIEISVSISTWRVWWNERKANSETKRGS